MYKVFSHQHRFSAIPVKTSNFYLVNFQMYFMPRQTPEIAVTELLDLSNDIRHEPQSHLPISHCSSHYESNLAYGVKLMSACYTHTILQATCKSG